MGIKDIEDNITDLSNNRIIDIEDDITDISSNKDFIRHLQSVDYSILLANAPAQWPTPPINQVIMVFFVLIRVLIL
jgi:hypothetical protein